MAFSLPPFKEEIKQYARDLTQKRYRFVSKPVRKGLTYVQLEVFTYFTFGWGGYSHIVAKYNFYLNNNFSFLLPLSLATSNAYCPCVAWKPTDTTIVRYKLWEGVGEVLYVPLYSVQVINKNFSIEIWVTPNPTVNPIGKIYTSIMNLPTSKCDFETETDISGTIKRCTDIQLTYFLGVPFPDPGLPFNPSTEKYVLLDDCGSTNRIPL